MTLHVKIRHLRKKGKYYYFEATPKMKDMGVSSENLGINKHKAIIRAETLNDAWDDIRSSEKDQEKTKLLKVGTIGWLINRFQKDRSFYLSKASGTQKEIDFCFGYILPIFGDVNIKAIERKHCRAFYNQLAEEKSDNHADKVLKYFTRLLNFAIEEGIIQTNPSSKLGKKKSKGRSQVWTIEDIHKIIDTSIKAQRPSIALAVQIAYNTAQRQQDILDLRVDDLKSELWEVIQKKTGKTAWASLSEETINMLREYSGDIYVIENEVTKTKYERYNFGHTFVKIRRKARLSENLRFHDLRRTAATEMANAGATIAEITAVTGHSITSKAIEVYAKPGRKAAVSAEEKRTKNN